MSDHDSDFSDDDEPTYTPVVNPTTATVTSTPIATFIPTPTTQPTLLLAVPCHVAPPLGSSTLQGCGCAFIYTPTQELPITITLYDTRKK